MQWPAVKPPPRLHLLPRPSRLGCALVGALCAATSLLPVLLPLSFTATAGAGVAVLAAVVSGCRRTVGGGVPALLQVGADRRVVVAYREGRLRAGSILDDSYVGAWLTTLVWRADDDPWWRPARTILVLPDTLAREDHRQLRVALRYGRPAAGADTRADEQG